MESLGAGNALLIEAHLAGRLDTTGHHVEINERVIGGEIIKILMIDGKG